MAFRFAKQTLAADYREVSGGFVAPTGESPRKDKRRSSAPPRFLDPHLAEGYLAERNRATLSNIEKLRQHSFAAAAGIGS